MHFPLSRMERWTFFLASVSFCLFLTVTLTSAMTTDCLCDQLPGDQCADCPHRSTEDSIGVDQSSGSLQLQYKKALLQEDREFHEEWIERNRAFHTQPRTAAEEKQ